ncbi:MAG: protein phosphatase CheZ [Thermomonas sp.]|jgi:chemotaxis protein CheZ|uniref:protein phosphatase CheZ n=1 Tax=Thermomonas sp. TaxID=1971895 RepID=UPI001EC1606A|nr:protein phosphatase CheZ [Thermomonas sp.]MBV2210363.1 protein phosphatase CheZ [Thermomonas sp.]
MTLPEQPPAIPADEAHIAERLRAAMAALEQGDGSVWRRHLDSLMEWRRQPVVASLVSLARELDDLERSIDARIPAAKESNSGLPDACSRLEHVVKMTEEASMRTLDLADECRTLLGTLGPEHEATVEAIRSRLSQMAEAQGFQDLTGQIIQKVIHLIRSLQSGLGDLKAMTSTDTQGHGPAVQGVDPAPATQDEANDLLAALGI